uniref:Uncharacterized protein n=1 Tax=Piliocolobus tephrosceles TaxID=591936 RepID=A0A8C9LYR2_9PRIM
MNLTAKEQECKAKKLRRFEEFEDTCLPYLTPKDDEFYQQWNVRTTLILKAEILIFSMLVLRSHGM